MTSCRCRPPGGSRSPFDRAIRAGADRSPALAFDRRRDPPATPPVRYREAHDCRSRWPRAPARAGRGRKAGPRASRRGRRTDTRRPRRTPLVPRCRAGGGCRGGRAPRGGCRVLPPVRRRKTGSAGRRAGNSEKRAAGAALRTASPRPACRRQSTGAIAALRDWRSRAGRRRCSASRRRAPPPRRPRLAPSRRPERRRSVVRLRRTRWHARRETRTVRSRCRCRERPGPRRRRGGAATDLVDPRSGRRTRRCGHRARRPRRGRCVGGVLSSRRSSIGAAVGRGITQAPAATIAAAAAPPKPATVGPVARPWTRVSWPECPPRRARARRRRCP